MHGIGHTVDGQLGALAEIRGSGTACTPPWAAQFSSGIGQVMIKEGEDAVE